MFSGWWSVTDANGGLTSLEYDALGRQLKVWGPSAPVPVSSRTKYDGVGRVVESGFFETTPRSGRRRRPIGGIMC